ncbi:hypothetical protein ACRAWD_23000 [Caulobacter segnis]
MPDRLDLQPVLHAAMTLVAADGPKGLSLEPLAEQLGQTVSALTPPLRPEGRSPERPGRGRDRAGRRVPLIAGRTGSERWRSGTARPWPSWPRAILSDLAGPEALRTRFYCELLQGVVSRPELAAGGGGVVGPPPGLLDGGDAGAGPPRTGRHPARLQHRRRRLWSGDR